MGRSAGRLAIELKGPNGAKNRRRMRNVLESDIPIDQLPCQVMIMGIAAAREYVADTANYDDPEPYFDNKMASAGERRNDH
jgi:hypothetical protein